jgi:hypothetical protein
MPEDPQVPNDHLSEREHDADYGHQHLKCHGV